jgi:glyoxylase I family protein
MALLGFSHVGICVSDLDRSARFYRDVLGFTQLYALDFGGNETAATMEQQGAFGSVMLRRDDLRLELLQWVDVPVTGTGRRRAMTELGFTHLSFRVDDVDELSAAVRAAGGNVHEHTLSALGEVRLMYVTDPDGIRVEFMANVPDLATLPAAGSA